jgi:hypothetical protein
MKDATLTHHFVDDDVYIPEQTLQAGRARMALVGFQETRIEPTGSGYTIGDKYYPTLGEAVGFVKANGHKGERSPALENDLYEHND